MPTPTMACCCVTSGDGIEPWDLPIEPEHGAPTRMTQMDKGKNLAESRNILEREREEVKIGIVTVAEGAPQGLELLHSPPLNLVVVCGISDDGPWAKWNSAHPDHMVRPGDEIVEVNGKRGDYTAIVQEMSAKPAKSRSMTMTVRRPFENKVVVYKSDGDTLGLILVPLQNGLLFIDAVSAGGVIDGWNAAGKGNKVKSLDQVVEVNKKRGSSLELVEAMKQDGSEVEMVFLTH